MPLTNSEWCDGVHNTTNCCQRMAQPIYQCKGIEYEYFCEDETFFESLNLWFEIPIDIIDVILSIMIILISIYGKINGTFKWCIMNIAILHLLYPIFSRFIAKQAIAPHCSHRHPRRDDINRRLATISLKSLRANSSKSALCVFLRHWKADILVPAFV
ncbi:hypothetical protein DdX_14823 [Ditylenchus destructor]|uniref:Uncharacterized protein n=1 Tax=Ditylenchus destructor TaxID=166010 RepID=A0AAD4MTV6_9BILA|nr:hypothetical protein DdX_14823 [Ditylenchus destructor]